MKIGVLSICLLCLLGTPGFAKEQPEFHSAKVISQNISSEDRGYAVIPIGTSLAGVPISRRSDIVVVETSKARLTLSEMGHKFIVLPVNGTIEIYQDGNQLIVLDSNKKKHKFALVHMETLQKDGN